MTVRQAGPSCDIAQYKLTLKLGYQLIESTKTLTHWKGHKCWFTVASSYCRYYHLEQERDLTSLIAKYCRFRQAQILRVHSYSVLDSLSHSSRSLYFLKLPEGMLISLVCPSVFFDNPTHISWTCFVLRRVPAHHIDEEPRRWHQCLSWIAFRDVKD